MTARRYESRVVVVTGAGRGLGRALAQAFAAEGASVVLAARSADRLHAVAGEITSAGGSVLAVPTDVRDVASVDALRDVVEDRFGAPDVLVAAAGATGAGAPLWEQPVSAWEDALAVNVTGVFLACRAFLPSMVQRGDGNVLVVGSTTGSRPLAGRTPYAASTAALAGLVRTLAWELAPHGIRANLLSPGPVAGRRLDRLVAEHARGRGVPSAQARRWFAEAAPLGRLVEPAEVAARALWLASPAASAVTGEEHDVAAGARHG